MLMMIRFCPSWPENLLTNAEFNIITENWTVQTNKIYWTCNSFLTKYETEWANLNLLRMNKLLLDNSCNFSWSTITSQIIQTKGNHNWNNKLSNFIELKPDSWRSSFASRKDRTSRAPEYPEDRDFRRCGREWQSGNWNNNKMFKTSPLKPW